MEFTKILLLLETYQRPIGDLSETHRRPTFLIGDSTCFIRPTYLIGDPSEIDMPHPRPICPIRYRLACEDPPETTMPEESNQNSNAYMFEYTYFIYFLIIYIHVSIRWVYYQCSDIPYIILVVRVEEC